MEGNESVTEKPVEELEGRELDAAVAEEVFGQDLTASDPESIGKAVMSGMKASLQGTAEVEWNGTEYKVPFDSNFDDGAPGNLGHGYGWWQDREGKPWQDDLEEHVKNWRADPPHYSSEPMDADTWSVVEELGRRGYHVSVCPSEPTGAACVVSETARGSADDLTEAETTPLAIRRAALKAVRSDD